MYIIEWSLAVLQFWYAQFSGDDVPSNSPVKAKFLSNFGNSQWRYARGVNGISLLSPKDRGFVSVALIYSPDQDLSSDRYFIQQELKPISGMVYEIVMHNIIDIVHLRHPNAREFSEALANAFSSTITKDNTKFMESLATHSSLSNSFCGFIVTPRFQKWWRQTPPSKGTFWLLTVLHVKKFF